MKYQLIALDFDGTLLNDQKEVTTKTKEILEICRERQCWIVGVTARALGSVQHTVPLSMFDYLILNNGAYFYDVKHQKGHYVGYLDKEEVIDIIKEIEPHSCQIDLVSGTKYYFYKNSNRRVLPFMENIENMEEIQETIARMNIFFSNPTDIDSCHYLITKHHPNTSCFIMQDSRDDVRWLVINPKGVNKKTTLYSLGQHLHIDPMKMIFFGDGRNDLEVIDSVGKGVAMENALDDVKKRATDITLSNNEDGIAVFLEDYLKQQKIGSK